MERAWESGRCQMISSLSNFLCQNFVKLTFPSISGRLGPTSPRSLCRSAPSCCAWWPWKVTQWWFTIKHGTKTSHQTQETLTLKLETYCNSTLVHPGCFSQTVKSVMLPLTKFIFSSHLHRPIKSRAIGEKRKVQKLNSLSLCIRKGEFQWNRTVPQVSLQRLIIQSSHCIYLGAPGWKPQPKQQAGKCSNSVKRPFFKIFFSPPAKRMEESNSPFGGNVRVGEEERSDICCERPPFIGGGSGFSHSDHAVSSQTCHSRWNFHTLWNALLEPRFLLPPKGSEHGCCVDQNGW